MVGRSSDERTRFVEHQGVRILLSDYSGIEDSRELEDEVGKAIVLVQREPPLSVLVLVKLEGVPYTLENVGILKVAVTRNRPFVKARAVVGLPAIAAFSFSALARLSNRPMASFRTQQEALAWLMEHA